MNHKEALEYMDSLKAYGIVPGLDSIKELCRQLSNPQDNLSFVHIAGTNGKGSTLAYISTVLKCAGYKVGRYISPVISNYCEKIQINGRQISQKSMAEYITRVKEACEVMTKAGLHQPTPFEVETATAFLYFKESNCDIVVLETGMGGREDATNLIKNTKVAVLSSISMDHMQFLGNTLDQIAWQKAGIIKDSCYVVSMEQAPQALAMIRTEAEEKHCPVTVTGKASKVKYGLEKQRFTYRSDAGKLFEDVEIPLSGPYQIENTILAMECIDKLGLCGFPVSEKDLRKGLLETKWPGRFQVLSKKPYFIVDGAHNEDAAKKLADSIRFYFTNKRIIYIMGVLRDKEYEKIITLTCSYADQIITITPPQHSRALSAIELAQSVQPYHNNVTAAGSLEEAVEMAYLLARKEDVIISFGSLSYLGRLIEIMKHRKKK
ncbi:MAG TPA: folylpolyglutamate synthase/dihydrofolate synthase family protein [Lachnospiraceae bacterium]|nr:folylpolyglutamate synthase/dihydrofolate synthase family protein [Lachnospiraceae bacterium]